MCVRSVCSETVNHQLDNDTVCMQIMATRYTHTHLLCADLGCMGNDRLAISSLSRSRNENSCEKAQKNTLKMFLSWGDFCFRFSRFSETNKQINIVFCHHSTILVSVPSNSSTSWASPMSPFWRSSEKAIPWRSFSVRTFIAAPMAVTAAFPTWSTLPLCFLQGSPASGNGHISGTQMTFWRPHLQSCVHYFLKLQKFLFVCIIISVAAHAQVRSTL